MYKVTWELNGKRERIVNESEMVKLSNNLLSMDINHNIVKM